MATQPREVVSFNDRLAQFQMARDIARTVYGRYQSYRARQESSDKYYVSVEDDDRLFEKIQTWLLRDADPDAQRSIAVESERDYENGEMVYSIKLLSDSDYETEVLLEGQWISVEITTKKVEDKRGTNDESLDFPAPGGMQTFGMASAFSLSKRVIFTAKNKAERDIVIRHLQQMAESMSTEKREPGFYTALSYGGWRRSSTVMRRPLDAVILAGDNREKIVDDLTKFLDTEERYINLGLPWHHGYLFEGPPGTGKTSLAAALASTFNFDVYYIPLSTIESDSKLMECVMGVDSGKAVLVMEDVDIVSATRDRDDTHGMKGITLQGLLNALDGIATPHGLITIMTTNDVKVLDPALIRPGRVDYSMHVGYVTDEQLQRLCKRFIDREIELPHLYGRISPAQVVGVFKDGDHSKVDEMLRDMVLEANLAVHEETSEESVQSSADSV